MSKTNLAWVLVAAWVGCTTTTTPAITPTDAGADVKDGGKPSTGDSAAPPTDGGTKKDGETTEEDGGGTVLGPCTPIGGGLPCETGKIYCGASQCDMATQECCVDVSTGAGTCTATGTCNKAPMGCDEARDCQQDEVCCFTASGTTPTGAICVPGNTCQGASLGDYTQSCRSDDECFGTGTCIAQTCKGFKIQTCQQIPVNPCP